MVNNKSSTLDCPVESVKYLAGYIAFRCTKWNSTLGTPTGLLPRSAHPTLEWIGILSQGGFTYPSDEWLATIKEFEVIFAGFHGSSLSHYEQVMKSLRAVIQGKFPTIDGRVISVYVRTRAFIRLKYLNRNPQQQQEQKRAAKKNKQWAKSQHCSNS